MSAAVLTLFVLVGLAFPLLLYVLVRAEHDQRETMDRETAERVARRDTADQRGARGGTDDGPVARDDTGEGWGARDDTNDEWGAGRDADDGQ